MPVIKPESPSMMFQLNTATSNIAEYSSSPKGKEIDKDK